MTPHWFRGYVSSFFSWKGFLDFLYLAVTYLNIFMCCAVFWLALRARHNTNNKWKYKAILHTKNLISYSLYNCLFLFLFFSDKSFCSFLIRREKQSEKKSPACAADRLTVQNNQLYNIAVHMWYKYSRSLSSTLCSLIVKSNYLFVLLTDVAP